MRNVWFGLLAALALASPASAGEEARKTDVVIGVTLPADEGAFREARQALEAEAAALGVTLDVASAQWSQDVQAIQIEEFVERRVQGILVQAVPKGVKVMGEELGPIVDEAVAAGIPVVTAGGPLPTDAVVAHVSTDLVQAGRVAAKLVLAKRGTGGAVLAIEGPPGAAFNAEFVRGFEQGVEGTGARIVARAPAGFARDSGKGVMAALIGEHPRFAAVLAVNDPLILGALDAMAEAGVDPATKVTIGIDGSPEARQAVQDGRLTATFDHRAGEQARRALRALVANVRDGTRPARKVILVAPELVAKHPQG
jgi:ABC-type sugar transport system substrate-binding protein